jgi:ABC-type Fe3+ transport system substrate-binding protein
MHLPRPFARHGLPAAILAVSILVWTRPGLAITQDEIFGLKDPDRQSVLETNARKEGEVAVYTANIIDQVAGPIAEAFQKKYPFMKVRLTRLDTSDIMQRVLAESRARSIRVDVVVGDLAVAMKESGLAQAFSSPLLAEYPDNYVDPDRTWVAVRSSWQGIAWNTRLVSDAEAPRTWEAALDPKWKGKLVWSSTIETGAPRLIGHLRAVMGEEKALAYLNGLKAQGIRTISGSIRSVLDQIVAGEHTIGLSMAMHHIAISKSKGAPVDGVSPEPVLTKTGTMHYVKGAPHPAAGMLYFDFMLLKEGGQTIYRDAQYNPSHPGLQPLPEMRWIQPKLNGRKEFVMAQDIEEEMTRSSNELYRQIFR